ncbi:hypothetical protein Dsin_030305 [Dipteronia sinensis]|uniref:Uncharacterized protein n=1 Tax=Dipteronia sinensis TaxID=43782 RepID=A0AAE0DR49_9ROSI|nr:hypothetical protein Dsin_030305 [Dipteronia sinensis]
MHNMIIEDERTMHINFEDLNPTSISDIEMVSDETTRFRQFLTRHRQIKDKDAHIALRNALIDHL